MATFSGERNASALGGDATNGNPTPRPDTRSPYGPLPAASALAMAGLALVLSMTAQAWAPVVGDMGASTSVASVMPDSAYYPMTLR